MRFAVLAAPELEPWAETSLRRALESGRHELTGVVIDARPSKPLAARLRDNLRRGRGGYVLVMAATLPFRRSGPTLDTRAFATARGIPVSAVTDLYGPATVELLQVGAPEVLVLLGGWGIVRAPVLDIAPHGVVAYHHGDMRRYRGQPPGLWELLHGDASMGVTVQRLSAGLDAGEPIVERTVPIEERDTPGELLARALESGTDMLAEALDRLEDPARAPIHIETYGPVYTLPNLRQWALLWSRVVARRARAAARDRRTRTRG
jgi:hypothetical protein